VGLLLNALRNVERKRAESAPPIDPTELEPGLGATLLSPFSATLDALDYLSATTRAGIGQITGAEGSGRETLFGPAPSGRELLGIGQGTPGEFESGDVAGFAVELAADPLNLLGVGALSKGGKAAKAATEAGRRAKALSAVGRTAEAADYAKTAYQGKKALQDAGLAAQYGRTLAEQAKLRQRSLLSFDVPFTDINVPISLTGGRVSEAVLGGAGAVGRAAKLPFRPLSPLFRRIGRAGAEDIVDVATRERFNDLVEVADDSARQGVRMGREEQSLIDQYMKPRSREMDAQTLADIQARVRPFADQAASEAPSVQRMLRRAAAAKNPAEQATLLARADRMKEGLLRRYAVAASPNADPRESLLMLGLEKADVPSRLDDLSQRTAQKYAEKIDEWNLKLDAARTAGDGKGMTKAQGVITRLNNNLAAKAADIARRSKLSNELVAAIPPDVLTEANRISTVLDGRLATEIGEGVNVKPLADPDLSYAHRAITDAGRELSDKLKPIADSPFVRYARVFNPEKGFTKQRVKAFDGMTISQINDWARTEARRNGIAWDGDFFVESPSEIVLRRLTDSGRSIEHASLLRGTVEAFHVPAGSAARGVDIAEFLERANLAKLGGVDTVGSKKQIAEALKGTAYEGAVIPRDVADAALKTFKIFDQPDELKKLGSTLGKYNAMMRFWLTIPFPAYHVRNAASNVFMNWMAGMDNPSHYFRAGRLMRDAKRALLSPASASQAEKDALATIRKIEDLGAAHSNPITETLDLAGMSSGKRMGAVGKTLLEPGQKTPLVGAAAVAGQWIENNAKIALFLDGKAKGMTDAAAADRVKKFLFNYSDLSQFEKDYLRKWSFFYTFQRKNIPLMIDQIVTNPRRMRAAGFTLGYGQNESDEMMTEYQRSKAMLDLNATDENGNRLFFGMGLPIEGLTQYEGERKPLLPAAQTVARKLLSNLVPAASVPIQMATGVSLRTGQPTTLGETLLSATPMSRVVSTAQRALSENGDASVNMRDAGLSLLALAPTRINPEAGKVRRLLEQIDNRKRELVQLGRANSRNDVYATSEATKPELSALNSLEAKLRKRRKELVGR